MRLWSMIYRRRWRWHGWLVAVCQGVELRHTICDGGKHTNFLRQVLGSRCLGWAGAPPTSSGGAVPQMSFSREWRRQERYGIYNSSSFCTFIWTYLLIYPSFTMKHGRDSLSVNFEDVYLLVSTDASNRFVVYKTDSAFLLLLPCGLMGVSLWVCSVWELNGMECHGFILENGLFHSYVRLVQNREWVDYIPVFGWRVEMRRICFSSPFQ